MKTIALLVPAATGHLDPMLALGKELQKRGFSVTVFSFSCAQKKVERLNLGFCPLGLREYPDDGWLQELKKVRQLTGIVAAKTMVELYQKQATIWLREVSPLMKKMGIDLLIADQTNIEGSTIAETLGIPLISIANALLYHRDPYIPPVNFSWQYNRKWSSYFRNQIVEGVQRVWFFNPLLKVINQYRQENHLFPYSQIEQTFSTLAIISQQPPEFEFPRQNLPPHVYFTGPFFDPNVRNAVDFPREQLTQQPLIYASLGTLQQNLCIYSQIAEACLPLNVQLVISSGKVDISKSLKQLPKSAIVVQYVNQRQLLQNASLTITHAGLNTVLDSLSCGVPLVALPIAYEQPGIASRILWTGTGEVISPHRLTPSKLRNTIIKVLTESKYKQKALSFQSKINQAKGVEKAADIINSVVV